MAKAIIWVRTSTEEQEIDTQRALLTEKAKRDGFKEEDLVYIGAAGASAIKMNELYQREVNELIGKIESDPDISAVYVWEVSRLARNELAFYEMKNALIGRHIQLVCDVPSIRLLDEDGEVNTGAELSLNLLVTLAKQEMTIKKKRMSRGKKRLAEQGKYNGGAIPYGYRINEEDKRIVPDEGGEADVVREIYNLYEHGMSVPKIARELYNRGLRGRSARRTDNTFTMSLVHQILTNKLLTGAPNLNVGSSYERTYPMIITPEQFDRCRKIAEMNNTAINKSLRVYYAHRLIQCLECGRYFVSTGNKGYYHCWDAYYINHDINGTHRKCNCRVCISTNIIDSLLWALAIDYETMYVISSAQQKIDECENAIAVLEQKQSAVSTRRKTLEEKMDALLDALAEGMKKEKFAKRKNALKSEERQIDADEAMYLEQIKKYGVLMAEAKKSLDAEDDFSSESGIDAFIDKNDAIRARIASITDDEERSRIIHKHIEKVTIENTTINYTFNIHPEGIQTRAKRILVYSYMTKHPAEFFFVPNNGKGGVMLFRNHFEGERVGDTDIPEYGVFNMEYLPRIFDEGKRKRREMGRARRELIKSKGTEELRAQGYISMNEMRELSGLSYSTLYHAIKVGDMEGKNMFKTWYAKKEDFDNFIQIHKPRPNPSRQTSSVYHFKNERDAVSRILKVIQDDSGQ